VWVEEKLKMRKKNEVDWRKSSLRSHFFTTTRGANVTPYTVFKGCSGAWCSKVVVGVMFERKGGGPCGVFEGSR